MITLANLVADQKTNCGQRVYRVSLVSSVVSVRKKNEGLYTVAALDAVLMRYLLQSMQLRTSQWMSH